MNLLSCGQTFTHGVAVIDKKDSPVFKTPYQEGSSRLQTFTSFPRDITTILAARRCPAVTPPGGNTSKTISIFTSTGFGSLTVPQYASAAESLRPDIIVLLADLLHTSTAPAAKRQLRMAERTEDWVDEFLDLSLMRNETGSPKTSVFAPILPVEHPIQWSYLNHLSEDLLEHLAGLAVYDVNILPDLTSYTNLTSLPKLSLDIPKSPQDVLRQISLGVDMIAIPFVNDISDAGVALTFTFPPQEATDIQPLGTNMWLPDHKASLEPLKEGCQCYTCQKHHKAFVNHLLNAKEMLGWNLLQIHNHHVLTEFFAGIRASLAKGLADFEEQSHQFLARYEPELPLGTGQRPRARGYHFKSEAAQDKYNKSAWQDLNGSSQTETPLAPDVDGQTLAAKGFAEKQG